MLDAMVRPRQSRNALVGDAATQARTVCSVVVAEQNQGYRRRTWSVQQPSHLLLTPRENARATALNATKQKANPYRVSKYVTL